MSLNIKFPEAVRATHQLAESTGESVTTAVLNALPERLARRAADDRAVAERLLEIGRDTAGRLPPLLRSAEHGDLLYDERGLPR